MIAFVYIYMWSITHHMLQVSSSAVPTMEDVVVRSGSNTLPLGVKTAGYMQEQVRISERMCAHVYIDSPSSLDGAG